VGDGQDFFCGKGGLQVFNFSARAEMIRRVRMGSLEFHMHMSQPGADHLFEALVLLPGLLGKRSQISDHTEMC
jgi:hypothetical protein